MTTTKFQIDTSSTISGVISGAGILSKRGAGTLTLSGNNTYSGGTQIINGTLSLGASNRLDDASRVSVSSPGVFDLNGFSETIGSLEGDGNVANIGLLITGGDNTSTTYSGSISGTSLRKTGTGTMTLSGVSSYSGGTNILGGTLSGNSIADQGNNSAFGTANFLIGNGATLEYTGTTASTNRNISLDTGGGTVSVSTNGALTVSGVIDGSGLKKDGAGTLILSGANTYTGGTGIVMGTLQLGNNERLADGSPVAVAGGTLDLNNFNETIGGLYGNGNVALGNGTLTTGRNDIVGSVVGLGAFLGPYSGVISGTGGLTKTGTGTLILSGNNTYTGATNINQGALQLTTSERIADTSAVTLASGATFTGADETIGSLSGSGNTLFGDLTVGANNASTSFSGTISGGRLLKIGSGTLAVSGNNSYGSGTVITGGTLSGNTIANQGINSAFGQGNFTISNGATLRYTGPTVITNRTISLGTGGGTIDVPSASTELDWNAAISGTGGLTKSGAGYLVLLAGNSYSGTTTVNGGNLIAFNSAGSATSSGDITLNSGFLWIGFNTAFGAVSGNIIDNTGVEFYRTDSFAYGGQISGTGYVEQFGTGTVTLTGDNTYSGNTYITHGTLAIGANERLPNASRVIQAASTVFALNNFNETIGSLEGTGTVNMGAGNLTTGGNNLSTSYSGQITGTGGLTKTGTGTMTLSGSNSYSGTTTISGGILSGNTIGNIGSNSAFGAGSSFNISNGATLQYTGSTAGTNRTLSLGMGGGAIDVVGPELDWNGTISGTGGLTKSGAGYLLLVAGNSYSGTTTVNGGNLVAYNSAGSATGSGDITINSGFLWIGFNTVFGAVSGNIINSTGVEFYRTNSLSYAGQISGSGYVEQFGAGILTLTGDNTYSGTTYISRGTLAIGANERLPNASRVVQGTGTVFALNNFNETIGSLEGTGAVNLGSGNLTTGGNDLTTAYSGQIVGSGGVTKAGTGTMTLSGSNSYGGTTTISGGTLSGNTIANSGSPSAFGTGSSFSISNGATLQYTGPGGGPGTINRTVSLGTGGGTLSVTNELTLSGVISGSGGLTKTGPGVLQLNASNTYSGSTTINQGIVRTVTTNERIPDGSAVTVASGATLDLNTFNETIGSLAGSGHVTLLSGNLTSGGDDSSTLFSGDISGTGTVTKNGSGTMTVSGSSSYAGGTTINSGTLTANNATGSATGTGSVIVNSGGTLAGIGSASGSVTVNAGGAVSPGNSIGTLAVGGLTLASSTAVLSAELDLSVTPAADLLNVTGAIDLGSGELKLSLLNLPTSFFVPKTFLIVSNDLTDVVAGSFATISGVPSGYGAVVNYAYSGTDLLGRTGTGNDVAVTISFVPEAGSFTLVGLVGSLAAIAIWLRNRWLQRSTP